MLTKILRCEVSTWRSMNFRDHWMHKWAQIIPIAIDPKKHSHVEAWAWTNWSLWRVKNLGQVFLLTSYIYSCLHWKWLVVSSSPETWKARSPKMERLQRGATSWRRETERMLKRALIADGWVKDLRWYPLQRAIYKHHDFETDALRYLQPVEAHQDVSDMDSLTKIEDHTSSSILDALQARNEDIRESEQDAVAVVESRELVTSSVISSKHRRDSGCCSADEASRSDDINVMSQTEVRVNEDTTFAPHWGSCDVISAK
jgi:hypothetical protein